MALPKSVNGECNQQVIADNFSKYFASAFSNNSAERNIQLHAEFNIMKADYKQGASLNKWKVNEAKILDLILNLKSGKASGLDNLTAEHLRYAHPSVAKLRSDLFNLMICFEYVPDSFGIGMLIVCMYDALVTHQYVLKLPQVNRRCGERNIITYNRHK